MHLSEQSLRRVLLILAISSLVALVISIIATVILRTPDQLAYRVRAIVREAKMISFSDPDGEGKGYLHSEHFALYTDNIKSKLFYKTVDTWNAAAEVGVFIPSFSKDEEKKRLYYGVDFNSNYIYIITFYGKEHYVNKNVFTIHFTHKEICDFFNRGDWEKYGELSY